MSRKGENIFLRKDGRWEARYIKMYNEDNKAVYGYVYGKTYLLAKRKRNDILLKLPNTKKKNNSELVYFDSLIDSWILQKKVLVKESTFSRYLDIVNKHIKPYFGKIKLNNITDDVVTRFILLKIKTGLKEKTIKDIAILLKQIFKYGKLNIIVNTPKVKKNSVKILTLEEQKRLENYIKNNFDNMEFGILLALYMGLRIGEICALRWQDIDLKNHVIEIKHTISRIRNLNSEVNSKTKLAITEPKTDNSKRVIPIPSTIIDFVKILSIKCTDKRNYVLTNSSRLIEPRSYYNKYKNILKKLGMAEFSFHSLRHTFATRCIELGFDPKTLSEILGHSDIRITLAFYVHPTDNQKIASMEKLSFLSI